MQASSVKEAISARPGLVIIKFWQGAVEIGLRTAAIVLGFASMIASANTLYSIRHLYCSGESCNLPNSARFLLILALTVILYEAVFITARFINFNFISAFSKVVFLVDICVTAVIISFLLIGAGVCVAYANKAKSDYSSKKLITTFNATAVLSFLLMFGLIPLAVWMALFLCMKWNHHLVQLTFTRSQAQEDDEATLK